MKSFYELSQPGGDTWLPSSAARRTPPTPIVPLDRIDPKRAKAEREARERGRLSAAERGKRRYEVMMAKLQGEYFALGKHSMALAKNILRQVELEYGVTVHDLKGPWRKASICRARLAAYYRIRMETSLSYPEIGGLLGGRNHTTVMAGAKSHARRNKLPMPGESS